jgi:predicted ATP-grasp superfamily ATP-dependent carboligase
MQCNVVVIGGDHYNTYGVIRSLGEVGITTSAIIQGNDMGGSFVIKSRYVTDSYVFYNDDECIPKLLSFYRPGCENFVIACSDEIVELLMANYSTIADKFILPLCKEPMRTKELMNKSTILEEAIKYGIVIPKSWTVLNRIIPDGVTFPCITKPLRSIGGSKSDIIRCNTRKELEDVIYNHIHCSDYQIQQFIDYEKEVSILGAVLKNGDVVFSGCIDKLRTCMIGTSSYAVMKDNVILGDSVEKLRKLITNTGYTGLFSAEFLLYNGIYYFLEINFRNDGNGYVATSAGINTPYLWIKSFLERIDTGLIHGIFPCFFMLDIEDFLSMKRNDISLITWLNNCRKTNCFLVFNIRDIKPFIKKLLWL